MASMLPYPASIQGPTTGIMPGTAMVPYGHTASGLPNISGYPGVNSGANLRRTHPYAHCHHFPYGGMALRGPQRAGPPRPPQPIVTPPEEGETRANNRAGPPRPPQPVFAIPSAPEVTASGPSTAAIVPALPAPEIIQAITYEPDIMPIFPIGNCLLYTSPSPRD